MSAEPQGLTSFALSLLLVFRTNSSYGRFDEARKIWGGILNRARNIANQVGRRPCGGGGGGGGVLMGALRREYGHVGGDG